MCRFGAFRGACRPAFRITLASPQNSVSSNRDLFKANGGLASTWLTPWRLVPRLFLQSCWATADSQYGRSVMNRQATGSPETSHEVFEAVRREHRSLGGKVARIRQALAGDIITGEKIAAIL
jgi:hypothetical protein